jgi:three-Cys-motif partner protein
MILGSSGRRIAFVDGFSGPWKSIDEQRADTSFGQSWDIVTRGVMNLRNGGRNTTARLLWIEKEPGPFAQLEAYAKTCNHPHVTAQAIQGCFEDHVGDIADWVGNDMALVFVDPFGYDGLIDAETLSPLLAKPNVELLINYMWEYIRKAWEQRAVPGNRENLEKLFGADLSRLEGSGESELLDAYEATLRARCTLTGKKRLRVLSFPIHHAQQLDSAKYYLVHATHDIKGLLVFAEVSDKEAKNQVGVCLRAHESRREARMGSSDMFSGQVSTDEIWRPAPTPDPWLKAVPVSLGERAIDQDVWADMIEDSGSLPSQLQEGFKLLSDQGIMENASAGRRRPKNPVHPDKGEIVRRIK